MNLKAGIRRAIARGKKRAAVREAVSSKRKLSAQKCEQIHTDLRMQLINRLDECFKSIVSQFPEFHAQMVASDAGWGVRLTTTPPPAKSKRGAISDGATFELLVSPLQETPILELVSKAKVRDQEVFQRSYSQPLSSADTTLLFSVIEQWCCDFVEGYVAMI